MRLSFSCVNEVYVGVFSGYIQDANVILLYSKTWNSDTLDVFCILRTN